MKKAITICVLLATAAMGSFSGGCAAEENEDGVEAVSIGQGLKAIKVPVAAGRTSRALGVKKWETTTHVNDGEVVKFEIAAMMTSGAQVPLEIEVDRKDHVIRVSRKLLDMRQALADDLEVALAAAKQSNHTSNASGIHFLSHSSCTGEENAVETAALTALVVAAGVVVACGGGGPIACGLAIAGYYVALKTLTDTQWTLSCCKHDESAQECKDPNADGGAGEGGDGGDAPAVEEENYRVIVT